MKFMMETLDVNSEEFPFPIKRIDINHPSVTERYFNVKFFIPQEQYLKIDNPVSDQCVLIHSNKVSLITLAPNHPIVKEQKEVTKVSFIQQGLDNKVSGKHKKGGQKLKINTVLCKIHCKDEKIYTVLASMRGFLLEINKKLIDNPQLVLTDTWSKGYIAIVSTPTYNKERVQKCLLDFNVYQKKLKEKENLE